MNFKRTAAALLAPALIGVAACSNPSDDNAGPRVVAAFYALEYAANTVAGVSYEVESLTMPGVDAHDIELSPGQVAKLAQADLVIHLSGFQPAVDEAIETSGATNVLDVADVIELLETGHSHDHDDHNHDDHEGQDHDDHEGHDHDDHEGHDHGDHDPHFWLDPIRLAAVGDAIADELAAGGGDAAALEAGAAALRADLTEVDEAFRDGLAQCERTEFVTSHSAFGYLADSYGLTEIGIAGISPHAEASPARIAEVHALAEEHGITTIFFETLTSDAVAKSIAGDLGLTTAVLDPLEGISDQSAGEDYPSIMRANLEALRSANGCS